jgi:hypothetical protein
MVGIFPVCRFDVFAFKRPGFFIWHPRREFRIPISPV